MARLNFIRILYMFSLKFHSTFRTEYFQLNPLIITNAASFFKGFLKNYDATIIQVQRIFSTGSFFFFCLNKISSRVFERIRIIAFFLYFAIHTHTCTTCAYTKILRLTRTYTARITTVTAVDMEHGLVIFFDNSKPRGKKK